MRAIMRGALGVAAFGALFATAGVARAGELPAYQALPSGRLTGKPVAKPPASIPAREHVAGFVVAAPKFPPTMPATTRHVSVVGSTKTAEQIRSGEGVEAAERGDGACFTDAELDEPEAEEAEPHEWAVTQSWQVNLWPKSKDNNSAGVGAVHREQVVQAKDGKTTLESVDAWVDPATRGVRLIGRASLPLVQVGSSIGGLKIYAGREERAGGGRYVHYVVVRLPTPATERLGTMIAMRQDGSNAHGNGCGHMRVPLVVEKNDGDTAVVIAPVELPAPPRPKGEEPPPVADVVTEQAVTPANAPVPLPPKVTAAMRRRLGKRGRMPLVPPAAAMPALVAEATPPVEREVRTRDMQVHLGVSQSSRDPQPLLSVSYGWAGREQVQRITDEPTSRVHQDEDRE